MLSYLAVRGLSLLEDARLELSPGFNVLTGETGAGKSMVVDGLGLVHGARGQRSSVRSGTSEIEVDAEFVFEAADAEGLASLLAEHGLPPLDAGSLLVQRSVPKQGRSRCFVQGRMTTLPVLARIGAELVEITSQHEHQSLTSPARQLALLDAFAELGSLALRYGAVYRELSAARSDVAELSTRCRGRALRADLLKHQLGELEELAPARGERQRLAGRVALLTEARCASELGAEACQLLLDDEQAALPRLLGLCKRTARAGANVPGLARLADALERVSSAAEDALGEARALESELDAQPGELEAAQERLAEIDRLSQKHAAPADCLPDVAHALAAELDELESADGALEVARERERSHRAQAEDLAEQLHRERAGASERLESAVSRELGALCMPDARLEVRLSTGPELGASGRTRVELLLAANPGEPPAPLAAVASGGELSRLLLAVRSVVSRHGPPQTYVFDEVDAGVGGRVAEAIGVRLAAAARHHQVLCITHLPQIAAFASTHFRVQKRIESGRTVTRVEKLDGDARRQELGRMLGGAESSALAHADALLGQAARELGGPEEALRPSTFPVAGTAPPRRPARGRGDPSNPRARNPGRMLV